MASETFVKQDEGLCAQNPMWPCRAGNRVGLRQDTQQAQQCPGRWWGELAEKGQRGACMGDELGVHCLSFSPHPLYAVHLGSQLPSLSTSPASQYSGKVCICHLHYPSCWALCSSAAHTAAHFLKGKACPLPRSEDSYVPAPLWTFSALPAAYRPGVLYSSQHCLHLPGGLPWLLETR